MIKQDLNKFKIKDIYSLLFFALYKLKDVPEYSTLSELAFVLDKDNLLMFLEYFGGTTIKIPTVREFKLMLNCLLLYEYVNLENIEFSKAISLLDKDIFQTKEIKEAYTALCDVLSNYQFKD